MRRLESARTPAERQSAKAEFTSLVQRNVTIGANGFPTRIQLGWAQVVTVVTRILTVMDWIVQFQAKRSLENQRIPSFRHISPVSLTDSRQWSNQSEDSGTDWWVLSKMTAKSSKGRNPPIINIFQQTGFYRAAVRHDGDFQLAYRDYKNRFIGEASKALTPGQMITLRVRLYFSCFPLNIGHNLTFSEENCRSGTRRESEYDVSHSSDFEERRFASKLIDRLWKRKEKGIWNRIINYLLFVSNTGTAAVVVFQ